MKSSSAITKKIQKMSQKSIKVEIIDKYIVLQQRRNLDLMAKIVQQSKTLPNADRIINFLKKLENLLTKLEKDIAMLAPLQYSEAWEDECLLESVMHQIQVNTLDGRNATFFEYHQNESHLNGSIATLSLNQFSSQTVQSSSKKSMESSVKSDQCLLDSVSRNGIYENCSSMDVTFGAYKKSNDSAISKKKPSIKEEIMVKFGLKSPTKSTSTFHVGFDAIAENSSL